MSKLSRILVATDFSPSATHALMHAAAIAARTGAELHVLHVQVLSPGMHGTVAIPNVGEVERVVGEMSRRDLDEAVASISLPIVREVVADIKAAPAILHYSKAHGIDLVLMGTHARRGVSRMFLGSVVAEVLRESSVSVMAIGPEHAVSANGYRRVLATVDFSDSATTALQQAAAIAKRHAGELFVVHVIEARVATPYDVWVEPPEASRQQAIAALDTLLAQAKLVQAPQRTAMLIGAADEQIATYAREHEVDLIVMGSVGLSGLGRLLLGSTTERVLRKASCAVLAQRGPLICDNL